MSFERISVAGLTMPWAPVSVPVSPKSHTSRSIGDRAYFGDVPGARSAIQASCARPGSPLRRAAPLWPNPARWAARSEHVLCHDRFLAGGFRIVLHAKPLFPGPSAVSGDRPSLSLRRRGARENVASLGTSRRFSQPQIRRSTRSAARRSISATVVGRPSMDFATNDRARARRSSGLRPRPPQGGAARRPPGGWYRAHGSTVPALR